MFGGHGLYCGSTFFGIIFKGRLYLKTDPESRGSYQRAGMKPFCPNATQTLTSYYEVPADVLEDAEELRCWVAHAVACSRTPRRARPR